MLDGFEQLLSFLHRPLSKQCAVIKSQQHQEIPKKSWERRESNPGQLGEKRKRYLCAMPTPAFAFLKTSLLETSERKSVGKDLSKLTKNQLLKQHLL